MLSDNIVHDIYGDKLTIEQIPQFSSKAILSPLNSDVDEINTQVTQILEGNTVTYLSADSIKDASENDVQNYPIEFLNSLCPSGMAPHKLELKLGSIIMLLRNFKREICNGTRMIVTNLKPDVIVTKVLCGSAKDDVIFIPRIKLEPQNSDVPFTLCRRQFPVKVAFGMTINKSQGQTLQQVGIYLPNPVFGHGQLYVAFSRVRRGADVKVKIVDGEQQGKLVEGSSKVFTKNVVYREIFDLD
jgi:ATP-dependent DNA helicase PIF1